MFLVITGRTFIVVWYHLQNSQQNYMKFCQTHFQNHWTYPMEISQQPAPSKTHLQKLPIILKTKSRQSLPLLNTQNARAKVDCALKGYTNTLADLTRLH